MDPIVVLASTSMQRTLGYKPQNNYVKAAKKRQVPHADESPRPTKKGTQFVSD